MSIKEPLIFVVEDEPDLAGLLRDYLQQSGFSVRCIGDGSAVVPAVKSESPDLILLDLMLPGTDGMSICRSVRSFSQVPIIMVTARVEEIDRLLGLELGADDYICKPFSPREVVARVKAVLRRVRSSPGTGSLIIDEQRYKAELCGQAMDLTAVEFQLLRVLASEPGRIFNRAQLMDSIYPDHRVVSDRTIDSHIKKLRKKIEKVAPDQNVIYSVYGVGYKFEAPL